MVGLAQLVRASDCGPEGRRFKSDIPPQISSYAGIVQRLVYKFSKLGMAVRFCLPAPFTKMRFRARFLYGKRGFGEGGEAGTREVEFFGGGVGADGV